MVRPFPVLGDGSPPPASSPAGRGGENVCPDQLLFRRDGLKVLKEAAHVSQYPQALQL